MHVKGKWVQLADPSELRRFCMDGTPMGRKQQQMSYNKLLAHNKRVMFIFL